MNDYKSRFLANAITLYDARRAMGFSELTARQTTSAGLAQAMTITRDKACALLLAALKTRSETPTMEILSC